MTAKDIKRQDVIHGKTEWLLTTGGGGHLRVVWVAVCAKALGPWSSLRRDIFFHDFDLICFAYFSSDLNEWDFN